EIVRFLAQRAPFNALAVEELAEVAAQAAIEFHLHGAVILSEDGGPVTFLRVIHSGGVDITHEGRLLDLLGPGDTFGDVAMLSGLPPGFEARAAEDTLCYRIPVAVARPLLDRARRRELRQGAAPEGLQPVARLIRSATVTAKPSESIGTVAERMTRAGATAAVVMLDGGAVGILTDRDLRSRVLAVGRNGGVRVDSAMTAPAYVVAPDRLGADVLYEMLERGIRHVPVISERGQLVGVLEDADLFATQPRSWFGARRAIARARNLEALAEAAGRLPALMLELHASSVPALELARVLSALADALTVRALQLAGADPAQGPVYVAVGSQARRELTPGSTWRGALVGDAVDGGLHAAITDALSRCGVQGPIVIRSADDWLAEVPGSELAMSVLADRRVLWGTPAEPLPTAADARGRVVEILSQEAFAHVPPTGFDADSVLSPAGRQPLLNIRSAAIVPIAAIGAWAAAAADVVGGSTPERLAGAAAEGVLSTDQAATLSEAFELALELRIVHHLERLAAGEQVDDLLDPAAMTPLTRSYLRDVFRAVSAVAGELRP
ncbi:MAG TPA: putative nucleotidyltransferase substrate binding domain-containing protein, partial [Solirubrobacteraceae bacterium]|nr:putative nucleotidyltransferase substrate binding domain-containing protein [Solirubrobacteraceae bacterium]